MVEMLTVVLRVLYLSVVSVQALTCTSTLSGGTREKGLMCSNLLASGRKLACFATIRESLIWIHSRTAICRGAIYKGFLDGPTTGPGARQIANLTSPVTVASTIARLSLGITFQPIFEEGKHRQKDKYFDELEGVWRAEGQMEWYLRKVSQRK